MLAGTPRLVLLSGEPGIGKTRLASQCDASARAAGATVVWGVCAEAAGTPPYWLWQQVLRGLAKSFPEPAARLWSGPHAADLRAIVPDLWAPPAAVATVPLSLAAEEARFVLGAGIAEVLAQVAREQPLVVILDDLHAADLPSLHVLQVVVRALSAVRVLLLGTYREADLERRAEHGRLLHNIARGGERIPLRGLSVPEVADYLQQFLAAPASAELASALQAHTGGNPLFVQELARRLVAERRLDRGGALDLRSVRVPEGVRGAIRERLEPLSATCQDVLRVAAVVGDTFHLSVLRSVCNEPSLPIAEALHEAAAAGLALPCPGSAVEYAFAHPLIRETLYQDLGAARIGLHRRIAAALVQLPARDPDQHDSAIAYHAWQAAADGNVGDAVRYSRRAAERALSRWAYEDAIEQYRHALEALEIGHAAEPRLQCELRLALGAAQQAAGDPTARQSFETAASLARDMVAGGDAVGRLLFADAALGVAARGFGSLQPTPDPGAAALLEEALAQLPEAEDRGRRALLLGRLALEFGASRDEQRSLACSAEAERLARSVDDPRTRATVLSDRYAVLWGFNFIDDRLQLASQVMDLAAAAGAHELALRGRGWRLIELLAVGDLVAFDEELRRYEADAGRLRQPRYDWVAANARALRALWSGAWDEAEGFVLEALALSQQGEDQALMLAAAVQRFWLQRERGAAADAEPAVRRFAEQFVGSPIPRCFLGIIALDGGRLDEAALQLTALAEGGFATLRRERRLGLLPMLVELAVGLQAGELAAPLEELLTPYAEYHVLYGPVVDFGACSRYLAQLSSLRDDWPRAQSQYEDALRRNQAAGGRPLLAWTQFDYASELQRQAESSPATAAAYTAKAQELLALARATAESLGMVRLRQRLDALHRAPERPVEVATKATAAAGVFRCDGEYWTVSDGAQVARLKDSKGLGYIALLLRHPEREFAATELAFGPDGAGMATDVGEPLLDATARSAYRQRLIELREEIDEAESRHDIGRADALRTEADYLTDEVARAAGLHGRVRRSGSGAERARLNVTRAIKTAIRHIGEEVPVLARYLETTLHTGRLCGYTPDPRLPIAFDLGDSPGA